MWNPEKYDDRAIGPMGLHDAYLLEAICKYVRPRIALEFGGLLGHSLSVMAGYCDKVISVDDNAHQLLYDVAVHYPNVAIFKSDMRVFYPNEFGIDRIDLVLFDASHLYNDSITTFRNIEKYLSPKALILVHDTGDWKTDDLPPQWEAFKTDRAVLLEHDRKFVRFLRGHGYLDITFESSEHLRHGYSVLKKIEW